MQEIKELINLVKSIKKIEKEETRGTPIYLYPEGLYESLYNLGIDYDYMENWKKYRYIPIKEMELEHLKTYFTWVVRGERFYTGILAREIECGNILEALQRYESLLNDK